MKRFVAVASVLALSLTYGDAAIASSPGRHLPPLVSAQWLQAHQRTARNLVLIDIRTAEEYQAGHIANSVNIPFEVPLSAWITMRDELLLELPDTADLFATLGSAGIASGSEVVIVTSAAQPPYPQANAPRVADTLLYAGVRKVSVLDGGYPAWVARGLPTTTEVPTVLPTSYTSTVHDETFVDTEYVHSRIGTAIIVDARDPEVYSGQVVEPWADKAGHIPSAVSLPAPAIWNADGTYRSRQDLAAMVTAAIGPNHHDDEIIVYCGVGGYAGSWLYVLSAVLGYRNVKMYDGSAQEWVRYHDMEL